MRADVIDDDEIGQRHFLQHETQKQKKAETNNLFNFIDQSKIFEIENDNR